MLGSSCSLHGKINRYHVAEGKKSELLEGGTTAKSQILGQPIVGKNRSLTTPYVGE